MTVSLTTLLVIAPTLAARPDAAVWLEMSYAQHRTDEWGNVYAYAMAYHCAHRMTIMLRAEQQAAMGNHSAPAGPLIGATSGKESETYGSTSHRAGEVSVSDQEYTSTGYGLTYLSLRNSRGFSGPYVASVDV
jgi:hypothetical protein